MSDKINELKEFCERAEKMCDEVRQAAIPSNPMYDYYHGKAIAYFEMLSEIKRLGL